MGNTNPPAKRRIRASLSVKILTVLSVATLALSACGAGAQTTGNAAGPVSTKPVQGGTFVYAEVTPINNWQTQAARFYEKSNVLNSVLDRLTYFDTESGKLVGWIASDFEANKDQTE